MEDMVDALEVAQAIGVGDISRRALQVVAHAPVVVLVELDEHGHCCSSSRSCLFSLLRTISQ
jgi:hypothetical protein